MTTVVDINVLLDVFQNRQPHYETSARVLSLVCEGRMRGIFPAHGVTTLFYPIAKHGTRPDAINAVDRLMLFIEVRCLSKSGWKLARGLRMTGLKTL